MFTVFIEKEDNSEGDAIGNIIPEDQLVDEEDEGSIEIGSGEVIVLVAGEKAHDINPG